MQEHDNPITGLPQDTAAIESAKTRLQETVRRAGEHISASGRDASLLDRLVQAYLGMAEKLGCADPVGRTYDRLVGADAGEPFKAVIRFNLEECDGLADDEVAARFRAMAEAGMRRRLHEKPRRKEASVSFALMADAGLYPDGSRSVEAEAIERECEAMVIGRVAEVFDPQNPRDRAWLELRGWLHDGSDGHSVADLAEQLHLGEHAVRKLIENGDKRLRSSLESLRKEIMD